MFFDKLILHVYATSNHTHFSLDYNIGFVVGILDSIHGNASINVNFGRDTIVTGGKNK